MRHDAPSDQAKALFERGMEASRRGQSSSAEEFFAAAILESSHYVEAHRQYQNLLTVQCRRLELYQNYEARHREAPRDPVWLYLLGRLSLDVDRREELFDQALDLDPEFDFGLYGVGFNAEVEQEWETAVSYYRRAVEVNKRQPLFLVRLAGCYRRLGRYAEANSAYRRALILDRNAVDAHVGLALLHRDEGSHRRMFSDLCQALTQHPQDPSLLAVTRKLIDEEGSLADIEAIFAVLDSARSVGAESGSLFLTLASLQDRLGKSAQSCIDYQKASGRLLDPSVVATELRLGLVRQGRYAQAWDVYKRKLPDGILFDSKNEVGGVYRALKERILNTPGATSGADLFELAKAMERAGWLKEALSVYGKILLSAPDFEPAQRKLEDLESHQRFVLRLRSLFIEVYKKFQQGGNDIPDLEELQLKIEAIGREEISLSSLDLKWASYAPLGKMWSSLLEPQSALSLHFRRFNQFAILGRRIGGPPEMHLVTMASLRPNVQLVALGREAEFDEIIAAETVIPSHQVHRGDQLAAVAVVRTVLVDLDSIWSWATDTVSAARRWQGAPESTKAAVGLPLSSWNQRQDLFEPLCLAERLAHDEGAAELPLEELFLRLLDHVRYHEFGHVLDARRYLPLLSHPLRSLGLFIGEGFSSAAVQAYLEGSAEVAALASSRYPRLALSLTVANALGSDRKNTHATGYRRILAGMVERIDEDPERFPGFDPDVNVVQQLHRLTEEQIRELAVEVAADFF